MRAREQAKATAPSLVPLAMLLVPRCPLCLLPLFAAAGMALPSKGFLDALTAAAAFIWIALLVGTTRSTAARTSAISAAALFLSGRWLGVAVAGWAGVLLMAAVAIAVRSRSHSARPRVAARVL